MVHLARKYQYLMHGAYRKYVHSSWVGCQWSSRIAPGSTVTSATAVVVEMLKMCESTILTLPPESGVAGICDMANVYGRGTVPYGLVGKSLSGPGEAGCTVSTSVSEPRVPQCTCGEDVELFARDLIEGRYAGLEVFRNDFFGDVCEPVRDQERAVFIEATRVKYLMESVILATRCFK